MNFEIKDPMPFGWYKDEHKPVQHTIHQVQRLKVGETYMSENERDRQRVSQICSILRKKGIDIRQQKGLFTRYK